MTIKAIIFDLDDTLYDCSYTLTQAAQERAVDAMIQQGLRSTKEEALKAIPGLRQGQQGKVNVVEALVERFGPKRDTLVETGLSAYNQADMLGDIALFPGVKDTLKQLRETHKLILVTTGVTGRQRNKINQLGLSDAFDLILIDDIHEQLSKRERFLAALANYNLLASDVLVVGDRVFSEIKIGNQLGMVTVQMKHGFYAHISPSKEWEHPDDIIERISELPTLIQSINQKRPPRIVVIGGGTGLPALLSGLRRHRCELTAIVSVTDSGRSSGALRKEFDMAPPGDIRNCITALAAGDSRLTELLQYRFCESQLEGHTVGNLLLVALTRMTGSFGQAVQELSSILSTRGDVMPASLANLHIHATLEDSTLLETESAIVESPDNRLHERSPIAKISLSEDAAAYPPAVQAINEADLIVLGPGGLFTSVISNLLIQGIRDAINQSSAKVLQVCNLVTQPGQTTGYGVEDHVHQVEKVLGASRVDGVIVHQSKLPEHLVTAMKKVHSTVVTDNASSVTNFKTRIFTQDIAEELDDVPELWHKTHLLRHDANKLAQAVMDIYSTLRKNRRGNKKPSVSIKEP